MQPTTEPSLKGSAVTAPTVSLDDLASSRVLASGLQFPESLRFVSGEIYFSDISAVRAVDHKGNARVVAEPPTPLIVGICIADDGTVYAAGALDRKIYRCSGDEVRVVADLSSVIDTPINEFMLLPNGAMIVGSMGFNPLIDGFGAARAARMLLASPDGSIRETGPELMFANGMILADTGRTLWVVESLAHQIRRCTLSSDGEVVDDAVIKLQSSDMEPDGLAMTADGSLWFAAISHGAAVRINHRGESEICAEVADPHAPACAVYEAEGREWLAVGATIYGPGQGDPAARTGRIIAAPLDEIQEAATQVST